MTVVLCWTKDNLMREDVAKEGTSKHFFLVSRLII